MKKRKRCCKKRRKSSSKSISFKLSLLPASFSSFTLSNCRAASAYVARKPTSTQSFLSLYLNPLILIRSLPTLPLLLVPLLVLLLLIGSVGMTSMNNDGNLPAWPATRTLFVIDSTAHVGGAANHRKMLKFVEDVAKRIFGVDVDDNAFSLSMRARSDSTIALIQYTPELKYEFGFLADDNPNRIAQRINDVSYAPCLHWEYCERNAMSWNNLVEWMSNSALASGTSDTSIADVVVLVSSAFYAPPVLRIGETLARPRSPIHVFHVVSGMQLPHVIVQFHKNNTNMDSVQKVNINDNSYNHAPSANIFDATGGGGTWSADQQAPSYGTPHNLVAQQIREGEHLQFAATTTYLVAIDFDSLTDLVEPLVESVRSFLGDTTLCIVKSQEFLTGPLCVLCIVLISALAAVIASALIFALYRHKQSGDALIRQMHRERENAQRQEEYYRGKLQERAEHERERERTMLDLVNENVRIREQYRDEQIRKEQAAAMQKAVPITFTRKRGLGGGIQAVIGGTAGGDKRDAGCGSYEPTFMAMVDPRSISEPPQRLFLQPPAGGTSKSNDALRSIDSMNEHHHLAATMSSTIQSAIINEPLNKTHDNNNINIIKDQEHHNNGDTLKNEKIKKPKNLLENLKNSTLNIQNLLPKASVAIALSRANDGQGTSQSVDSVKSSGFQHDRDESDIQVAVSLISARGEQKSVDKSLASRSDGGFLTQFIPIQDDQEKAKNNPIVKATAGKNKNLEKKSNVKTTEHIIINMSKGGKIGKIEDNKARTKSNLTKSVKPVDSNLKLSMKQMSVRSVLNDFHEKTRKPPDDEEKNDKEALNEEDDENEKDSTDQEENNEFARSFNNLDDEHPALSLPPVDVLFLVDASSSIGNRKFEEVKYYLCKFVNEMDICPGRSRVAIILFAAEPQTYFDFNSYYTNKSISAAISRMPYLGGPTFLAKALSFSAGVLYQEQSLKRVHKHLKFLPTPKHDRPQVLIVISDGVSDDNFDQQAAHMHERLHVKVAALVTRACNREKMRTITRFDKAIFTLKEIEALTIWLWNTQKMWNEKFGEFVEREKFFQAERSFYGSHL